ncbi:MAG: 5-amino-6-(D-ribitylamino)uracil--L-tyrosine 4-hydroxyphenyl transferase CofH [Haliea sp.]
MPIDSRPAVHAVLPLKQLIGAKTRLTGLLDGEQRRTLALAMARDVLGALSAHPAISSITLVSDDTDASQLAAAAAVRLWRETDLLAEGEPVLTAGPLPALNGVLTAACARLRLETTDTDALLLVLHADLPLLTGADIDTALACAEARSGLVVGTDITGTGTNLLLFPANKPPAFAFGPESSSAHLAWAQAQGLPSRSLQRQGIARDIDTPADLLQLHHQSASLPPGQTRSWLQALAEPPDSARALALADCDDTAALVALAGQLRDLGHGNVVTYSRKVFIPLTRLCRDVCHYCTFATTPKNVESPFMSVDEVLDLCRQGVQLGCQEALLTLGEKPELRYRAAREALEAMGFASTLEYVAHVAERIITETGLLPHINAGCMTAEEIAFLRPVSASMGIMLESAAERLCEKGMPHHGSPDKVPAERLRTLALAGEANVPFTSGILIGIGETRRERIESLLALRAVHEAHGHLQEVIVQNFRAKPGTLMAQAPEPDLEDLLWTLAVARIIFGPGMSIQAPPNLSPGVLSQLLAAGINDWGGVSPLTPDHVNPEAPWPHLDQLARETAAAGKFLEQRLTIYPAFANAPQTWLDPEVRSAVLRQQDAAGFARRDSWVPGEEAQMPRVEAALLSGPANAFAVGADLRAIVERCESGAALAEADLVRLFAARGPEFRFVVDAADRLRRQRCGDTVSYVINRNINYTNVCYFKCQFCAFSKGKHSEQLRGRPYDISATEIARRCREAWQRGATEVCMQGGIHPDYTGQTYLDIVATVRAATPDMHIHAFSPLEVWQGAATLGLSLEDFLRQLQAAGLNTLPGTAAEILDDEVRATLCPDKLNTAEWLEVMETAHKVGFRTTATIMYGHIEQPQHWARHLLALRELQGRTGGFTELVPLPFVHMEAPMFLRGRARRGPTFREAVLMHSVSRLVLHGYIDNIQTSWVKMGVAGVDVCLNAGANDLGGTLMNESITRAAGAAHGQEWAPAVMEQRIRSLGRQPRLRTTLYAEAPAERRAAASRALELLPVDNADAGKRARDKRLLLATDALPTALPEQVVLMAACN